MRFSLIIIALILFNEAKSQNTFLKYYQYGSGIPAFVIREADDRTLYIASRHRDTLDLDLDLAFIKTNQFGDLISITEYENPSDDYLEDFIILNNKIHLAGSNDSSVRSIIKYGLSLINLNNLTIHSFFDQNNFVQCRSINYLDGYFYLAGSIRINNNANFYLLKIDTLGNKIWSKNYGNSYNEYSNSSTISNNNEIIITGVIYDNPNNEPHILTIKTDSAGNELWRREIKRDNDPNNECAMSAFDVLVAKNKNIYIAGYNSTDCDFSQFYFPREVGLLACLDSNGNELWTKEYHLYYDTTAGQQVAYFRQSFVNIIETIDGNLVCLDQSGGYVPNDPSYAEHSQISLVKLNLNGDTIWTRVYGSEYYHETAYDIIETKDKGIAICGRYADVYTPFQNVQSFVLKLDECGCLVPGCDPNCIATNVQYNFQDWNVNIYPNPANNVLVIETNQSIKKFTIYNLIGNKIFESNYTNSQIDINFLNPGYYLIDFIDSNQNSRVYKFIKN